MSARLTRSQRRQSLANVPFNHLPIELTTLILGRVACAHVETPRTRQSAAVHQICTIKLVCTCFAAIGDRLLAREAQYWGLSSLNNIVCEPTEQSLAMMRTIAANETLRPLIKSFICVDDSRCFGRSLDHSALIADTVAIVRQFPSRESFGIQPTWKRSTKMFAPMVLNTASFLAWFWEVARIVNEIERDHTLKVLNAQTSLFRSRKVHAKLDEITANVTKIELNFEREIWLLTKEEVAMGWGLVLQKARHLDSLRIDVLSLCWKEATRVWKGLLKGQHWPCLQYDSLGGPVIHDIVMDFLLANNESLFRINIPFLTVPCAADLVNFLDFLSEHLPIFEASILVPQDDTFDDDCDHLDDWEAIVDDLAERDGPVLECDFYDVGFYVLSTEDCYYDSDEEHWQAILSDNESESE